MKKYLVVILATICLSGCGFWHVCSDPTKCTPVEQQARNISAALEGTIIAAQAKYHDSCVAKPSQTVCHQINNGVAAENILITSLETYCGWSATVPPTDPNAKCVPVKTAQAALNAALTNATTLTLELKGVL